MPASLDNLTEAMPLGATLVPGGATFSLWAPGALHVAVVLAGDPPGPPDPDRQLVRDPESGRWGGFLEGVVAGTRYRFLVTGTGGSGLKRDPWARELDAGYPDCDCIVVDPAAYPWHDQDFVAPERDALVVYQLHIGVFWAVGPDGADVRPLRSATFLDALDRVPYLADLGVTAVQPLPVVEFQGEWSLGYNGTDLFSPERDYTVPADGLAAALDRVNAHLSVHGQPPLTLAQLSGQAAQLKAFIDICHLYGLGVLLDVVYNHAGGGLDAQSLDYLDLPAGPDHTNSIYFCDQDWAGGRVFDFTSPGVQDFLIGNADLFLTEYHADGLRFDEVSVIDRFGGWAFCQRLTGVLHDRHPRAILIAEYWNAEPALAVRLPPDGMGFDLYYCDQVRNAVRGALLAAQGGDDVAVDVGPLAAALQGSPAAAYQCIENQDLVLDADGDHRYPRIPRLADPSDSRSWYARSRARVSTAALLLAPGTPMLFMGQELLQDELWSDDPHRSDRLLWWHGLDVDPSVQGFHRYTADLVHLRRSYAALRAGGTAVHLCDQSDRVVAFHRWVPGVGDDVVVVLSLNESPFPTFAVGMPCGGLWREVFNSDTYDNVSVPIPGNGAAVMADGPPMHGLDHSVQLTVPGNAVLVLVRDVTAAGP